MRNEIVPVVSEFHRTFAYTVEAGYNEGFGGGKKLVVYIQKFVIGGKLVILPPGGSPVGIYTQPICRQSALLIIHVQAHGRTRLRL